MKKTFFPIFISLLLAFGLSSCLKDSNSSCTPKSVDSEKPDILAYASANSINGAFTAEGVYYQITDPGIGDHPTPNSVVSVNYVGKYLNGNIFDQSSGSPAVFPLSNAIHGWQLVLPLLKKGGSMKVIIPSSLAYGCTGYQGIPADAILYFEITLVDVQ
ncbi:MAG: FKBP-type peptidyl-prolyl cis-trans isomerase [Chitinophagaceae bacterium]